MVKGYFVERPFIEGRWIFAKVIGILTAILILTQFIVYGLLQAAK